MFSYPPTLPIHAGDNLVSDGQGFTSAKNSGASIETRAEKREFLLAAMLQLEFLRFNSNGNPMQWIHRCECYFRDCRTPENKRITYAAFHLLDDAQLWYHDSPAAHPHGSTLCCSSLLASGRGSRSAAVAAWATSRVATRCSWTTTADTTNPGSAHKTWTTQRLTTEGATSQLRRTAIVAMAVSR
jgi:hypothetical protein